MTLPMPSTAATCAGKGIGSIPNHCPSGLYEGARQIVQGGAIGRVRDVRVGEHHHVARRPMPKAWREPAHEQEERIRGHCQAVLDVDHNAPRQVHPSRRWPRPLLPGREDLHPGGAATAAAPARTNGAVTRGAAAFCSFLTSVNEIAARAASQQQGIQLLVSIMPRLQAQRSAAPAAVAADFGIVVTAAKQAVAQGNLSPLATNQVAAAGTKLTNYCHART
jgi:hypothetical protein